MQAKRKSAERQRQKQGVAAILTCLWADDPDIWFDLPRALIGKLDEAELALVARAALKALPAEKAAYVVENVFTGTSLEGPLPDMDTAKVEAEDWARHANVRELKDHIRAAVTRLPRSDVERLKRWIK